MAIKVTLPDGAIREYERGTTIEQVAESISARLKKEAVAGKINGKLVDVNLRLKRMGNHYT
ncbi:beta-grasp domain-containing protein [Paenibacillus naphthalenovorans]|uniref:Beta-grasp domain-containing protein n=1 Tax=Paenibacillus naphthalenovorans TaxID=162209 RepID=A0A0U2M3K8_9BACL|nr:beta-grasp domain-containing protein [Paenibacillus naphthalenovorans]